MCRPKGNGGLGLRKENFSNVALLAKMGWNLQIRQQSLCNEVFQRKYLQDK